MFGRRNGFPQDTHGRPAPAKPTAPAQTNVQVLNVKPSPTVLTDNQLDDTHKTDEYYQIKDDIFNALIEIIDVSALNKMEAERARAEIRDVVNELIVAKKDAMSAPERQGLLEDICN